MIVSEGCFCASDRAGFVDFVGSGGTFAGVAESLRAALPGVQCFVVEPGASQPSLERGGGLDTDAAGTHKAEVVY